MKNDPASDVIPAQAGIQMLAFSLLATDGFGHVFLKLAMTHPAPNKPGFPLSRE